MPTRALGRLIGRKSRFQLARKGASGARTEKAIATITERYRAIDDAFGAYPHSLHYALKANSTLAISRLLRSLGAGADANSGGEIDVALRAGFIPPQIVFTGVGKTPAELAQEYDTENVALIEAAIAELISDMDFYGNSLFSAPSGEVVASAQTEGDEIVYAEIDTDLSKKLREDWGFFRDRRPEIYGAITAP